MEDEDYQRRKAENMANPKNRFLFLFCHANEVDQSWGCNWSFATGVIMFSILTAVCVLADMYYIANDGFFSKAQSSMFKFMFFIKVFSDFVALVCIGLSCYATQRSNYRYSIVSYYVGVLSLLLCTIYLIYTLVKIFNPDYWAIVKLRLISWGFGEFALFMFCWILFCNMVDVGRKKKAQQQNTNEFL